MGVSDKLILCINRCHGIFHVRDGGERCFQVYIGNACLVGLTHRVARIKDNFNVQTIVLEQ